MDFFIKKIFDRTLDRFTHLQFQKFSRGEFFDRAMIRIKKSKDKFTIVTTSEYAKEWVINFAEKLGDKRSLVTGALIAALSLEGFDYKEKKSAIGVNKYLIEKEMSGTEILELCSKIDKAFFGLSFKVGDDELKIQVKSPKSAKGSSGKVKEGEKAKIDFCKIKTNDDSLVKNLVFDSEVDDFKQVEIKHDFVVEDIIISDELKKEYGNDFAKIREMAKRKGKIIRKINVDGRELKKEIDFEV